MGHKPVSASEARREPGFGFIWDRSAEESGPST
jgi:hypothetical protein